MSGGFLRWVGSAAGEDGRAALHGAAEAGLLGRELESLTTRALRPADTDELRARFERMFTSGIVYSPDEPIPPRLDSLPSADKRAAMAEAVAFSRELRVRRPRSPFQVTAFCEAGELRLIFLVSQRAPRHLRRRWEKLIGRSNLHAALAPGAVEGASAHRRLEGFRRTGQLLGRRVGG